MKLLRVEAEYPVSKLKLHPRNYRQHDLPRLKAALERGQHRTIAVREATGEVIAGNGTLKALRELGRATAAVSLVECSDVEAQEVLTEDNRVQERGGQDDTLLAELLQEAANAGRLEYTGYDQSELDALLASITPPGADLLTDPDDVPDVPQPAAVISKLGDLWLLDDHRLLCGDASLADQVGRLLDGIHPDCMLTDPPYCSGGFQEAGRSEGSIGTDAKIKPRIANDTLSTRGYMALMKSMLSLSSASLAYVFTDWRMWVNLFEVAESSGYGVRNMIVWDKGSPGMGVGWRTQHELVLFAARASVKFDNHKAVPNVQAVQRTGNPLHPTQKPVELLAAILGVTDMAETIYDPFAGSGSTLIAAHQEGRRAYAMELAPEYADVICRRFQQATGIVPVLESTGEEVDFCASSPKLALAAG